KEKPEPLSVTTYSNVCRTESFPLPENFAPDAFYPIQTDGEYIFFQGYTQDEANAAVLCRFDMDGRNPQIIYDADSSNSYTFDDGSVIKVEMSVGEKYWEEVSLTKSSERGDTDFILSADNLFDITVRNIRVNMSGEEGFYIAGIVMADDLYYIASDTKIAVTDRSGARKALIKVTGGKMQGLVTLKTGEPVAVTRKPQNMTYTAAYIDRENYKLGDKLSLPEELFRGELNPSLHIGDGYDIYIKNNNGLYGYDIGGEAIQIINWLNSDISGRTIQSIKIISPEEILFAISDWSTRTNEIGRMTLIPESELEEKITLILAKMSGGFDIENYIVSFNRQNDKYRILVNDYTRYQVDNDYERSVTMFNNDIAAGNVPDLFLYMSDDYSNSYPIDSYIEKGLFADIFGLLDSDEELSRDILSDYVRIPFAQDGKLYMLPHSVYINTIIGKKSNFPMKSWTQSEMIDYALSLSDDVTLLEYLSSTILSSRTISEFIDTENKTTKFNTDEFKKIIGFCRNYTPTPMDMDRDQRRVMYRSDKLLLRIEHVLSNFNAVFDSKYLFGGDISFIGYPSLYGNGSYISSHDYFSVSAQSEHIQGAWEFIKFLLSDNYQFNEANYNMTFPVTKSAMEKYIDKVLSTTYVRRSSGLTKFSNPLTEEEKIYIDDFSKSGEEVFVTTLSREEIDEFLGLLNTLDTTQKIDMTPVNLFWEEVGPYLQDTTDKPYDEIIRILQNRIEIYLNEKY
ncbi:MAG: extracellular solute-binding protein, partial [Eubacteriales bacterium]|nr:extracellular solute-binding protein [Eubacteriales bacterium]